MRARGHADARPVPATSPSRRGAERGSAATVGAAEWTWRAPRGGADWGCRSARTTPSPSSLGLGLVTCAGGVRRVGRVCVARGAAGEEPMRTG